MYPTRIAPNGSTNSTITIHATDLEGAPISKTIGLSTDAGSLSVSEVTTSDFGVAEATLTSATTPGTATVTASYGSISATVVVEFALAPAPGNFIAIATSTDRIALYWQGVEFTQGYNIYRSLSASGPWTKLNIDPISPRDMGPGLSDAFRYSDTGLTTDIEYFYYATAVDDDQIEGISTDIQSAIPEIDTIPWDTGNPQQIVEAVDDLLDPYPWTPITICAPNGIIYQRYVMGRQRHFLRLATLIAILEESA